MPELPDQPNLDQLRRQARELLRAAVAGQPDATAALGAVSERLKLSAAQLALARQYGYPSWSALKAEVEHRRRVPDATQGTSMPGADELGARSQIEKHWPFGDPAQIETSVGVLTPQALVVGPGHAVLHASLIPAKTGLSAPARPMLSRPGKLFGRWNRRKRIQRAHRMRADAAIATLRALGRSDDITVTDDLGTRYALQPGGMSGKLSLSGDSVEPRSVRIRLEPAPAARVTWIEVRGRHSWCRALRLPDETTADE